MEATGAPQESRRLPDGILWSSLQRCGFEAERSRREVERDAGIEKSEKKEEDTQEEKQEERQEEQQTQTGSEAEEQRFSALFLLKVPPLPRFQRSLAS